MIPVFLTFINQTFLKLSILLLIFYFYHSLTVLKFFLIFHDICFIYDVRLTVLLTYLSGFVIFSTSAYFGLFFFNVPFSSIDLLYEFCFAQWNVKYVYRKLIHRFSSAILMKLLTKRYVGSGLAFYFLQFF